MQYEAIGILSSQAFGKYETLSTYYWHLWTINTLVEKVSLSLTIAFSMVENWITNMVNINPSFCFTKNMLKSFKKFKEYLNYSKNMLQAKLFIML